MQSGVNTRVRHENAIAVLYVRTLLLGLDRCKKNLGQQVFDDMAVHIREPEVTALILVGETFVVYAEQVHHGGVEVMDMHAICLDVVAVVVRNSVRVSRVHPSPGHPNRKAARMVVTAEIRFGHLALAVIGPTEFASPNDERVV